MKDIIKAFVAAQSEFRQPIKNKKNPHFGNMYADLDEIIDCSRRALNKHGIVFVQVASAVGRAASVTTQLIHESGEVIEGTLTLMAQQETPQSVGAALTYARRYGAQSILGLAAEDDDDGNHASAAPKRQFDKPKPIQASAKPVAMFDKGNSSQVNALAKLLVEEKVPAALYLKVNDAMDKRPFTKQELAVVLGEVEKALSPEEIKELNEELLL